LLGSDIGNGFFLGQEMDSTGDDSSEECQSNLIDGPDFQSVFDDDELLDIFQSFSDDETPTVSPSVDPLPQIYSIQLPPSPTCCSRPSPVSMPLITHDHSPTSSPSAQKAYRQKAISRWLYKRQRRTFCKKVAPPSVKGQKPIPKRSSLNGRFVKSTTGFVSITALQTDSD
jgi:hypothetical protein